MLFFCSLAAELFRRRHCDAPCAKDEQRLFPAHSRISQTNCGLDYRWPIKPDESSRFALPGVMSHQLCSPRRPSAVVSISFLQVARGEIPPTPGISDARGKPSASSTSARDVGTEASGNNGQTIPQRCLDRSYSAADHFPNRRDLEMVPLLAAESTPPVHQPDADSSSSREASTTDPRRAEVQVIVETVKTMAGIKKDMEHMEQLQEGEGKYETSTSRVIKVDTLTASLSTAAGTSVSSDDKAALLGERTADVFDSPSVVSNRDQRNGRYRYPEEGASRRNSGVAVSQDVAVADGFEDRAGVRRRSFSNPYTGVLASRDDSRPATGSGKFVREEKALWCAGAVLLVVGSLVNFASFGFAPQSLLASLGSVQFVSNVVFGKVSQDQEPTAQGALAHPRLHGSSIFGSRPIRCHDSVYHRANRAQETPPI